MSIPSVKRVREYMNTPNFSEFENPKEKPDGVKTITQQTSKNTPNERSSLKNIRFPKKSSVFSK
jgi:hypothetical protein